MEQAAPPRPSPSAAREPGAKPASGRRRLPSESLPVALFCAWAAVPAAILFGRVGDGFGLGTDGRVFTGADQINVVDQLQYMAWIRDSGENFLFSNRFDLASDPHLFLHPLWAISGLVWKLGASIQLAYLMWRPVALVLLLFAFVLYVRRAMPADVPGRRVALLLALFAFPFTTAMLKWLDLGSPKTLQMTAVMGLEMFPGGFASVAMIVVGLMPLYLLGIERLVRADPSAAGSSTAWYAAATAIAGALTSWLHPWQGLTLLGIVGGIVVWERLWDRLRLLVVPLAATAAPFLYYLFLSRSDSAWNRVSQPLGQEHWGWFLVLGVGPALLLALPGLPGRNLTFHDRILRLWLLAAAVVYVALDRSWFYHAAMGLSLPLAILTVQGLRRLRAPRLVVAGVVALSTVPGLAFFVQEFREEAALHFIEPGEAQALAYLDRAPGPGGVLTRYPFGATVPAFSGRSTWVGHLGWTPQWEQRKAAADALFGGALRPAEARRMVDGVGARFLVADCAPHVDLGRLLGARVVSRRRFGCASVYELQPAGAST